MAGKPHRNGVSWLDVEFLGHYFVFAHIGLVRSVLFIDLVL